MICPDIFSFISNVFMKIHDIQSRYFSYLTIRLEYSGIALL